MLRTPFLRISINHALRSLQIIYIRYKKQSTKKRRRYKRPKRTSFNENAFVVVKFSMGKVLVESEKSLIFQIK